MVAYCRVGVLPGFLECPGERVGETYKVADGQRFAARAGGDALALELFRGCQQFERVLQRLATLPERGGDDAREKRFVMDFRPPALERRQARNRRMEQGGRPGRTGRRDGR